MAESSLAPTLLVSMPQLLDPNFERTVVLLCEHGEDGAFGLVINRPTDTSAADAVQLTPAACPGQRCAVVERRSGRTAARVDPAR